MLKPYEVARILVEPALPHLYYKTRRDLRRLLRPGQRILDVGGRRSPYTVGLPAEITIFDRPRESELQKKLGLGIDDSVLARIKHRRSNIEAIEFGDMTRCELGSSTFDGVVSVEVIEHVAEDDAFVSHIARVLRPGGWAYLTTPNGDFIENTNPDHVRHYRREELASLLRRHFAEVEVVYGVATTANWKHGLLSFSLNRPFATLRAAIGNVRNHRESRGVADSSQNTAHLFAIARRS